MGITITFPQPDGAAFPGNPQGIPLWAAQATFDDGDAVDGILWDLTTNEVYPSPGPAPSGPISGVYTWTVPFQGSLDGNIQFNDPLIIFCYDSETGGDGTTRAATASQAAEGFSKRAYRARSDSSVAIDSADLFGTTVPVTVTLATGMQGGIILMCANYTDGKIINKCVRFHPLPPSSSQVTRRHTFEGIDAILWTHICVIAVTKGHKGYQHPPTKRVF